MIPLANIAPKPAAMAVMAFAAAMIFAALKALYPIPPVGNAPPVALPRKPAPAEMPAYAAVESLLASLPIASAPGGGTRFSTCYSTGQRHLAGLQLHL